MLSTAKPQPPTTPVSALVKLRLLADPDIGMHGEDDEMAALQQLLVYFERLLASAPDGSVIGFGEPDGGAA